MVPDVVVVVVVAAVVVAEGVMHVGGDGDGNAGELAGWEEAAREMAPGFEPSRGVPMELAVVVVVVVDDSPRAVFSCSGVGEVGWRWPARVWPLRLQGGRTRPGAGCEGVPVFSLSGQGEDEEEKGDGWENGWELDALRVLVGESRCDGVSGKSRKWAWA